MSCDGEFIVEELGRLEARLEELEDLLYRLTAVVMRCSPDDVREYVAAWPKSA